LRNQKQSAIKEC